MTSGSYIGVLLLVSPIIILSLAGYWKLFQKAGRHGWEALIPIYSDYVMLKLSGRPVWWLIWLFIPYINIIVSIGIYIAFIKSYGKFTFREQAAGIVLGFIYLPKWGFDKKTKYLGPSASTGFKNEYPQSSNKSAVREWVDVMVFALIVVVLIRTFFTESYVIPTPSMERSLLVGDYLFVSKINYGARVPMTPVAFPFAVHTLNLIGMA